MRPQGTHKKNLVWGQDYIQTYLNRIMLRTAMKQMVAILYLVSSSENAPTYTPVTMEARTTSKRPPACSQCLRKEERK